MTKEKRIILFIGFFLLLIAVLYYWKGIPFPSDDVGILIFCALLMLSFVTLFVEHFFTKPTDVLSSTVSILLLLSPIRAKLDKLGVWFDVFYFYNVALALLSLTAILLLEAEQSQSTLRNRLSHNLKRVAVAFGNGRFLFFTLFVLVLLFYVDSQSNYFLILFAYSLLILLVDPKNVIIQFAKKEKDHLNDIGEVFG